MNCVELSLKGGTSTFYTESRTTSKSGTALAVSAEYDSALLVKRHTISIDTRIVMLYNNFAIIVKTKKNSLCIENILALLS